MQELRAERQAQLAGLQGMHGNSSALNALTRRAQAISNEAEGLRIVTDIGQKPLRPGRRAGGDPQIGQPAGAGQRVGAGALAASVGPAGCRAAGACKVLIRATIEAGGVVLMPPVFYFRLE